MSSALPLGCGLVQGSPQGGADNDREAYERVGSGVGVCAGIISISGLFAFVLAFCHVVVPRFWFLLNSLPTTSILSSILDLSTSLVVFRC